MLDGIADFRTLTAKRFHDGSAGMAGSTSSPSRREPHNGRLDLALQLIDAAIDAGADAVKFQAFSPEDLVTAGARQDRYQDRNGFPLHSQLIC